MARRPAQQDDHQENPDATVLNGGPGGDPAGNEGETQQRQQQQQQAPAFDPDAFYSKLRDEFTSIVETKVGALETKLAPVQQQQHPPQGADDFDTLFFTEPKRALETYLKPQLESIKTELTSAYNADRAALQQAAAEKQFWDSFYEKHDDLDRKSDHVFVQGVLQANLGALGKITDPDKLSEALADKTRESILAVSRRFKGGSGSGGGDRTETESGRGPAPSAGGGDDDNKLIPISSLLKARRQKRLKAAMGE